MLSNSFKGKRVKLNGSKNYLQMVSKVQNLIAANIYDNMKLLPFPRVLITFFVLLGPLTSR